MELQPQTTGSAGPSSNSRADDRAPDEGSVASARLHAKQTLQGFTHTDTQAGLSSATVTGAASCENAPNSALAGVSSHAQAFLLASENGRCQSCLSSLPFNQRKSACGESPYGISGTTLLTN